MCQSVSELCNHRYSGGDQLSGGPGKDELPHAGMFLSTMEVLAKFNVRTLNKINDEWEGNDLREIKPLVDGSLIDEDSTIASFFEPKVICTVR